MLGEGVRAAFEFLGIGHRTVCYVEREAPAAGQLVALMEAGAIDPAPVWSDLTTFDGAAWRGRVDCIAAGFPCQDISIAGRRAGLDGKRSGLFFDILDVADACGAWLLSLENVSAIATATASVVDEAEGALDERAASRVVGELADRGWDSEWITLSASDVGASHGRERWFCLAWRMADTGCGDARRIESQRVGRCGDQAQHHPSGLAMANAERAERRAIGIGGTGGEQGHDRGWRETHRGAGIAIETLGDAQQQRPQGCSDTGGGEGVGEARPKPAGAMPALALAARDRWNEGWPESGWIEGRPDATECGSTVADTSSAGCEGREQRGARIGNGGGGRKHMDQLANFVEHSPSSPQARPIPSGETSLPVVSAVDGAQLSPTTRPAHVLGRRRLNPAFGCWLMGWPSWWTNPGITSSVKSEMASYRCRLQSHLSSLLGEQESST
jgi:site-specific DNA-cytosine methylase